MEREEKRGYARGTARVLHSSIALHPYVTDDSGQALGVSPNHGDLSYRGDFGGVKNSNPFRWVSEAARRTNLATRGLGTSTKKSKNYKQRIPEIFIFV